MTFWRRWIKRLPGSDASRLARRETKRAAKKALTKGGRDDIIRHTLEAAEIAESEGDADRLRKFSYALLRLGQYGQAWELGARAIDLRQQSPIPEWEGDDLADRSILVRAYAPRNSIGEELRLSRFIAPLAQRARRCIVLAESRLVPLLRRSFAGVDARPRGVDDDAVLAEVDVAAYYETIAFHTVRTSEDMRHSFVTLNPDPSRVASIRQRYRPILDGPLIGISWWSSNKKKDRAPSLGWKEAGFVSLQYGDTAHDLEVLRNLAGARVIQDSEIDQLADLDGFAAQIAALDAVVSISNTTIDMAGMIGVPTVHIRDDKFSNSWPLSGPSGWYPDMPFLYRQHRPWPEVLAEARMRVERMISTPALQPTGELSAVI